MHIYIYNKIHTYTHTSTHITTNGVSTNGVAANFIFFDGRTFCALPLTYFYLPKSARAYLFPNLSKLVAFAAAPLLLTPFVRNP